MLHRNDLAFWFLLIVVSLVQYSVCLLPPEFEWKVIDFAWQAGHKEVAIASNAYIPKNNLPTGLARWREKLFITIPRWKRGIPLWTRNFHQVKNVMSFYSMWWNRMPQYITYIYEWQRYTTFRLSLHSITHNGWKR